MRCTECPARPSGRAIGGVARLRGVNHAVALRKRETVLLDTVQFAGVMEAKVTVQPELAVAVRGSCVKAYCVPGLGGIDVLACDAR